MNKFSIFSFEKFINKTWIIKFEILWNVQMKYGLNIIIMILFTQQVGRLGGKGVELYPWGPRIKLHKWHALCSTLEYWLNIVYLLRLPRLGGDMCQWLAKWEIIKLKLYI
jgi:hypothetical protein